ncbi:lipase (class 3) [Actinocrispum wychmicini]|uniref:Lipase (Class 3) n=2 Tax=Actinocrispum wychmicini TaxID=1213861 RepID=A0A4R2JRN8_9PSEU|nr:lipase (class 3) [Actinocrispum wychmicini]
MAKAAELAYQNEDAVKAEAGRWGFDRVRHHLTRFTPPFPLADTQAYTAASDNMIIIAFRGTEPAQIRDWLSDVNTPPRPGPAGTGLVHFGFAEALRSVWPQVKDAVSELRDNDQSVWFTGHSLGGALAMLAGAWLSFEDPKLRADGVYTFGQPRTCDRLLASAYNTAFAGRCHRFVNNNDIVPRLPPEPVYHHVDALRFIDAAGRVRESTTLLGGLTERAKGLTADAFAPASAGIRDHFMAAYRTAIEKNLT